MGLAHEIQALQLAADSEYTIGKSLRFNGSNSYLSKTFGAAGNRRTWTWSGWVKRVGITSSYPTFIRSTSPEDAFRFNNTDQLNTYMNVGTDGQKISSALYRDVSAWYHVVWSVDTTNAIASERNRMYVNGVRVTSLSSDSNPSLNYQTGINNTTAHGMGANPAGGEVLNGYMAEIRFIDGQALLPTSFGKYSSTTGEWIPIRYSGTYGTNGFWLDFANSADIGNDVSGNNNDWTPNNFASTDVVIDTPTNNFATLMSIDAAALATLSKGALRITSSSGSYQGARVSFQPETTKIYIESTCINSDAAGAFGLRPASTTVSGDTDPGTQSNEYVILNNGAGTRDTRNNNAGTNSRSADSANDVWQLAFDPTTGKLWFGRNNTWYGGGDPAAGTSPTYTLSTTTAWAIAQWAQTNGTGTFELNFGQGGQSGLTYNAASGGWFKYTPPSGFKALCTQNLPTPAIKKPSAHFDIKTYRGNGGAIQVGNIVKEQSSFEIPRSLRFNSADSAYLNRTFSTGNRKKWTWSGWIKRSLLGTVQTFFSQGTTPEVLFQFNSDDTIRFYDATLTSAAYVATTAVFRDVSKYYHILLAMDTDAATNALRLRLYVNGTEYSWASPSIVSGGSGGINWNSAHYLGRYWGALHYCDMYMSDVYFIDGQQLTPSDFGENDANGNWVPKAYSGTYGTNGFWLSFANNTSTTTLGYDDAGGARGAATGSNDWTLNNFSVTAGVNNDSLTDTPTDYGTDAGAGGEVRGNFATLSATDQSGQTVSDGGLECIAGSGGWARTTLPMLSGKWYCEGIFASDASQVALGIEVAGDTAISGAATPGVSGGTTTTYAFYAANTGSNRGIWNNGTRLVNIDPLTGGTLQLAIDLDAGKMWFGRNNTWYDSSGGTTGNPATGANPTYTFVPNTKCFFIAHYGGVKPTMNFGQRPFAYTAPSGFKALCTQNLAAMGEVAGSPDLVWIKGRSGATDHAIYDTIRGATIDIVTNSTAAQTTQVNGLQKFGRDGFYIGNLAKLNTLDATYVSWMWNEGVIPGFDIVSYTGTGGNRNISHGLGSTPHFIIAKRTDSATDSNWQVYHRNLTGTTYFLQLNTTAAETSSWSPWGVGTFNSSTFSVEGVNGTNNLNISGATYIAYLWTEVAGFSRFGTYTANNSSDGPFVWCGFRPRYILFKSSTYVQTWSVYDAVRNSGNPSGILSEINSSGAEVGSAFGTTYAIDILSNGFKIRTNSTYVNNATETYIFAAFAEMPFKYSRAR